MQAFLPLGFASGVGRDPAADPERHGAAVDLEGADRDIQFEARDR
jgi:hypothetical protein